MINESYKQYLLYVQSHLTDQVVIKHINEFLEQETWDRKTQYTIDVNKVFEIYSESIPNLMNYESFLRDKKLSQII